jgi:predicted enzyme related to lactoylglutathione lyase
VRKTVLRIALAAVAGVALAGILPQRNHAAPLNSPPDTGCTRAGAIWWNELLAPETERLTEFYAKVIGWITRVVDAEDETQPARTPADRYTVFMDGDQEVAGLMRANHPEAIHSGVGWFTYIQVADVDVAAATAKAIGGTVLRSPMETPEGHRIAVVSDPMGIVFGLVTPAKKGC